MIEITNNNPPAMPRLGKGMECVRFIASEVSEDVRQPVIPMIFGPLGANVQQRKFQYSSGAWLEICDQMRHLVGLSGVEL